VALSALLAMSGGVMTSSPALARGRGDGWQFVSIPRHFSLPAEFCGFKIRGTLLVDKAFVKALKSADGSITLLTGAVKFTFTNAANGKSVAVNATGPTKIITNPDNSATVLGKGHQLLSLAPSDQARFGLPGLFVSAGALTGTLAPDGTITSLTLDGHVLVNVCAALS
jgi:hypothetical protein